MHHIPSILAVDTAQYKEVFLIEKLVGLDLIVPDIQRNLDATRVQSIVDYQQNYFKSYSTLCFIGDLTLFKNGPNLFVIDGFHRLEAMKRVYMLQPDYNVSTNIITANNGLTLERAFLLLNMSKPVPEYVINTTLQHTKRALTESVRTQFQREFKIFISNSQNPRPPNVNLERLLGDILVSGLSDRFETLSTLMGYIKYANIKLASHNPKIKNAALDKTEKYDTTKPLYLSADPENKWMTNEIWIAEYQRSTCALNITANPLSTTNTTEIMRIIPRKRQGVPKAIRDMLWKLHFNSAPNGLCKCCGTNTIEYTAFHAGHIVAKARGGSDELSNLLPICSPCNLGMSTMNMKEFQNKYGIAGPLGEGRIENIMNNVLQQRNPDPMMLDD